MNYSSSVMLPTAVEDQLDVLPGPEPGTAIRICMGAEQEQCVRLEQLAYAPSVGWYIQKSFQIPAEMLPALAQQLRKAHCLTPHSQASPLAHSSSLRMGPAVSVHKTELTRRGA